MTSAKQLEEASEKGKTLACVGRKGRACASAGQRARAREAAAHFLGHRGYDILECAWGCPAGAVDIVARDGDCLVFADVSVGEALSGCMPKEPDRAASRQRMESVAIAYLAKEGTSFSGLVRFDMVSILLLSEDRAFVRHHLGAFSAA